MALAETAVAAEIAAENAAVGNALAGAGGIKTAMWLTPALGILSLAGIVAWEFWKGSKDEKELKAAKTA